MEEKKGYRASAKHVVISPSKLRRVANEVRRKPYTEAVAILESLPQKGARLLNKVVKSAAANALARNKNLDEEMLYISELLIDDGARFKRVWPRARGRRDILLRRMSHISVTLDEIAGMGA
ncbi:MAG: 50S ribosomal protein L22 [Spirochaetales bacterium]|nr:50S ribosomal protein L22 [Spirochaetales bacterium]